MTDFTMLLFLPMAFFAALSAVFAVTIFQHYGRAKLETAFGADLDAQPPGPAANGRARLDVRSPPQEMALLRHVVDHLPILTWQQRDGRVVWANTTYKQQVAGMMPKDDSGDHRLPAIFSATHDLDSVTFPRTKRVAVNMPGQQNPAWFETSSTKAGALGKLYFAQPATAVVRAEEALRNFVQTLTKTFAHLPIGLAIFDRQRQLALFNPALVDLTDLKPEWLSQRPSLFSFLDSLRENRHMPDVKNYPRWRRQMVDLEKQAEDGTYTENWALPSGQTYRVTGRPHPEGAVAFLFEDISAAISLQRRFRAELDLGQSVIDNIETALVVFAPGGDLAMSNDAFAGMSGFDPASMPAHCDVIEVTKRLQSLCFPSPIWGDLREFVIRMQDRAEWIGDVRLTSGGTVGIRISPLTGGATLCAFDVTSKTVSDPDKRLPTTSAVMESA